MNGSSGSLVGGSWLYLRECEQASPTLLSALASTLLNLNLAHTYTSATPVIQVSIRRGSMAEGGQNIQGMKVVREVERKKSVNMCFRYSTYIQRKVAFLFPALL